MKKSSVFSIYLFLFGVIVTLGYCLDPYVGIYRQAIVGAALILMGYLFCDNSKKLPIQKQGRMGKLASSILLACLVLLALALRLLVTQLVSETPLYHAEIGFVWRVLLTVVVPTGFVILQLSLMQKLSVVRQPLVQMLLTGVCFVPYCTHALYIPSAFVFGCGCYWLVRCCTGSYRPEILITYSFVMLFYDTLSISIGSIDFHLQLSMAISFFLFATSVILMGVYFALRVIYARKFRIPEFLTVLLVSVIVLLIGFAL